MPKEVNPFNMAGIVIAVIIGQIAFNTIEISNTAPLVYIIFLKGLMVLLTMIVGYCLGGVPVFLIQQEEVGTVYKVKSLKLVPLVHEERKALNDVEVDVSFKCVPQLELVYFFQGETTRLKRLEYPRVTETQTECPLYKVTSWRYKAGWHRFILDPKPTIESIVIPYGMKLYEN
ncbi:hypothetical protein KBA63_03155 [Candidatus Woesebacteria bacterium]|nr:hypothetical protein [Candidatus Woesebacteria bacterium]